MASKIVNKILKIDLHIHSIGSKNKDKGLVEANTIQNIPILMKKLEENDINMISITDHNNFEFNIYEEINKQVNKHPSLKKILPGIEFDVFYKKRLHVIIIFDDSNIDKLKKIKPILTEYPFDNTKEKAYSEKQFKSILQKINLNFISIVHQKTDVNATKQNQSLGSLGKEEFNEFIRMDYFDAVEFRNLKVEGMLKNYKEEYNLENLRYIVGSDCHQWSCYPQQKIGDNSKINFTYIKALPSFKGLVMAITEQKRISISSYSLNKPFIEKLDININSKEYTVPLAPGINVIIGDNSVGKSYLLNKIYDNNLDHIKENRNLKLCYNGYKIFEQKNKINFSNLNLNKDLIRANFQGSIRTKFEQNASLLDDPIFREKFPEFNKQNYINQIEPYINYIIEEFKRNDKRISLETKLGNTIDFPSEIEYNSYYLQLISDLIIERTDYNKLIYDINIIIKQIKLLEKNNLLEDSDKKIIQNTVETFTNLIKKYSDLDKKEIKKIKIQNSIKGVFEKEKNRLNEISQTQEAKRRIFNDQQSKFSKIITDYIKFKIQKTPNLLSTFKTIEISDMINNYDEFKFICEPCNKKIDLEMLKKILTKPIKNINNFDKLLKIPLKDLRNNLYAELIKTGEEKQAQEIYINEIYKYLNDEILFTNNKILKEEENITAGNSPGKNALYYLDILSRDSGFKLFIIDQPGDDVSQTKISNYLITILRRFALNCQVIFVTHKAELAVNLDVDNVIILKRENDEINIFNGALEYENPEINILNEVALILDGGVEIIKKRWKRYDKKNNS